MVKIMDDMTDNFCTILLNPTVKSDILAACIQADAVVRAAHEQAAATGLAGRLTVLAGAFAVIGGAFAYFAARRQVRLAEREHELLTDSYRRNLAGEISYVENEVITFYQYLKLDDFAITLLYRPYLPATRALLERMSSTNWRDLARVGDLLTEMDDTAINIRYLLSAWQALLDALIASLAFGALKASETSGLTFGSIVHGALTNASSFVAGDNLGWIEIIKMIEQPTEKTRRALHRLCEKVQKESPLPLWSRVLFWTNLKRKPREAPTPIPA